MKHTYLKTGLFWAIMAIFGAVSARAQVKVSTFVSAAGDDTEEYVADGTKDVASSDLELVQENPGNPASLQIVGLRFANVQVPKGAIITSAKIQFTYDNTKTLDPCILYFRVQDADNPTTFNDAAVYELRDRAKLPDSVAWVVPSWAGGATGTRSPAQLSSDLATLVQKLVNRPGWQEGNAMLFFVTGQGTREAESYEGAEGHGNLTYAPELIIEYKLPANKVSVFVTKNTDDMEEYVADGKKDVGSSDLELVQENPANPNSMQIIGLRFANVNVPRGAVITSAKIQFTYDNTKELNPCILYFKAEDSDNPVTYSNDAIYELRDRPKLADSVEWVVPSWVGGATGTRGPAQLSSDISALVQKLVNRPGWQEGNAMAFYITGQGTREAESYEGAEGHGNLTYAPELIIEYKIPKTVSVFVDQGTDDMEEYVSDGTHDVASSDLELVQENPSNPASLQIVGMRFNKIDVPKNATIVDARIQFTYDNTKTLDPCMLYLHAEKNPNPATFSNTLLYELRDRPKHPDSVQWVVPSWAGGSTGTRGPAQRTTNIATLVQRLVNDPAWAPGNAMAFYVTGQGTREAESYEGAEGHGNLTYAPELIITYLSDDAPVAPIGAFPIETGAIWSYYASATPPPANWNTPDFDDKSWKFGPAELGYGDGDEATVIPFGPDANNKWPVYYFRQKFVYNPNAYGVDSLIFFVKRDDGIAVYLNGTELFRDNLPAGPLTHQTLALSAVASADENTFFRFAVPATALKAGLNVLAASVHQDDPGSSDLSFDMYVREKKPAMQPVGLPMPKNSLWAFWDKGSVSPDWQKLNFNDTDWDYGAGPLGYGDPVNTLVGFGPNANNKYITTWFRKRLNITNLAALPDTLAFNVRRDDGVIVYVNEVEVLRDNMPADPITDNTWASSIVDGANETTYFSFRVPKSVFVPGPNILAVRVHQRDGTSSDLSFDLEIVIPQTPPAVASGCNGPNDLHIGCFTSVLPGPQTPDLIIPSSHRFQKIIEQGDPYTKIVPGVPFNVTPGNNDFTAFVGKNGSSTEGWITINHESTPGGVTIVDARYNATTKLWEYDTIQPVNFYNNDLVTTTRNCSGGITPWGTILTCEETFNIGDANGDGYQDVGWIVEIDPVTKRVKEYGNGKQEKLWAMGRMSHENAAPHPDRRTVYYAEDGGTSCVYKYVANQPNNLYTGALYVLRLDNPLVNGVPSGSTGTWVRVPNTTQADRNNTNFLAAALGGTAFDGPEDVEYHPIADKVYFTSKGHGRVYRFKDNGDTVSEFEVFVGGQDYLINYGTGIVSEPWGTGNDNLTVDDRGNLWVLQDGSRDHVWMVTPKHTQFKPDVLLFARTPIGSEPCGFHMTPDFRFGFLSLQSPSASNASTQQIDAKGNILRFDRSTSVVIARAELLGTGVSTSEPTAAILEMKVFPNPNNGTFTLELELPQGELVQGYLVDRQGRIAHTFSNRLPEGTQQMTFNLEALHLPSGQYVLFVQAGQRTGNYRIVIHNSGK
jgi:secreted PhoX family phosphatase